jgi:hypothetical protein
MTSVLPTVLNLFVALAGPHGTTMYVAASQIVAIITRPMSARAQPRSLQ